MAVPTVTRSLHIGAHRSAVWEALTVPELLGEWFGDSAELDPRVGGAGVLTWDDWGSFRLVIETLDAPITFAFRWARERDADPGPDNSTLATFTLSEHDGGTEVTVVETGWDRLAGDVDAAMADNATGWERELGHLRDFLERQDSV